MDHTIAVYIDGDNASYKDIELCLNEIKNYGRIMISKIYGDWSKDNMKNWLKETNKYGITPVQCKRICGKHTSDIKLCVDIMKDLYGSDSITLFYIITTDSDYRHVISEIKYKNKKVHCIGNDNANISLKSICDTYTKIGVLQKQNTKIGIGINENYRIIIKNEIQNLLLHNDSINISQINDNLVKKYKFDLREWGYNKMSKFLVDNFKKDFKIEKMYHGMFVSYYDEEK